MSRSTRILSVAVAVLVTVRLPIAWAVLFAPAKNVLPDITQISLRANGPILAAGFETRL